MTPDEAFAKELASYDLHPDGAAIGLSVSGGGDSTALMHIAADWARPRNLRLEVATIDHGLRPGSADEAAQVALQAHALGLRHETLVWDDWDGTGNLQDAAREARPRLLGRWADDRGLDIVLLGHTADDVAETFLMRLARGSGVDGLAPMARVDAHGFLHRPLLDVRRDALRAWLDQRAIPWIEDPSNDDDRFDRVRARKLLHDLGPLGLSVDRLTATAAHMARAKVSLWNRAVDWSARHVSADRSDLLIETAAINLPFSDTEPRVIAAAIQWMNGRPYRPRFAALCDALSGVAAGETRTLGGVWLINEGDKIRFSRELAATSEPDQGVPNSVGYFWDHRWLVRPPDQGGRPGRVSNGTHVAALGDNISQADGWRDVGLPRASLMATPGVFHDGVLIAAPVAGVSNGWNAFLSPDFRSYLVAQVERASADASQSGVSH